MTLRLLLVDDHRMLRQGLRRNLEDEGFDVVGEAADGLDAVDQAARLHPDLILMDVSMPELDGVEATKRIVDATPEQKVLMLTMHSDSDVIERALAAGAIGYLTKDSSVDEVIDAVRMAANGETVLSPEIASRMLAEVRRLSRNGRDGEQIISRREEEVLQLIADGCSTTEVAKRLYISQKTVKNHLASIYEKLDARDRTQAVLTAVRLGIVKLR